MIKGKLNNIEFSFVDRWSEMTLNQFIEIANLEIPPKLLAMEIANMKVVGASTPKEIEKAELELTKAEKDITEEDIIRNFPTYYGNLLKILTDNKQAVEMISWSDRTSIYDLHLKQFALSLLMENPVQQLNKKLVPYNPKEITGFKIGKEKFLLPDTVQLFNDKVLMGNEKIISFSESVDMDLALQGLMSGNVNKLPFFMAVYCRKKGETYSQQKVIARQKLFNGLTMDIVWAVFFYIGKLTRKSLGVLGYYSKVLELNEKAKLFKQVQAQKCEV